MNNPARPDTLFAYKPQIELSFKGKTIRFTLTESYHALGREPNEAEPVGFRVPGDWGICSRRQASFRMKEDGNYFIYDGDGNQASSNRLFINNAVITPTEGYRLEHGDKISVGQNPRERVVITYIDPSKVKAGTLPKQRSLILNNRSIVLGRDPSATLQLDAPTVSRHHATIDKNEQGNYVLQNHSINGVFVNDQKVMASVVLELNDSIRIGPYTFILQEDELVLADQGDKIRLDAYHIIRVVKDKKNCDLYLLNDISLSIEPGQLVAIVGGSGAGKSTLIKTLLGIESSQGSVYLNGDNLRQYFNIYRNRLGYVPQQDIVHTYLTVKEVLYYAAKLRLPPDIDIEPVVEKTINQIELTERKNTLVKDLSGGQLKRVSIGVELLADPKLFFLDEPTSGLDPGLDKKMMQLLRKLANEGRTVILVTHATSNINLCDRLVFLGLGGHLCYFGPPKVATEFFEIAEGDFAEIYLKLETRQAVLEEKAKYQQSKYYQEYLESRLGEENRPRDNQLLPQQVKAPFLQQLWVLIQRYLTLIIRDRVSLGLALLTAPIGIALITLAIRNQVPFNGAAEATRASLALRVLFVFTCAAIWVGLATSLQEIVKETAIYIRERLVNLGLFAYLGSKIFTLGGLAIIQSTLIAIVIAFSFKHPDGDYQTQLIPWPIAIFVTTFLTLMSSISLGLMVSASVKNTTQANSALPLLLLPQIIFAGVLFNMKDAPIGKVISWLMLSRWSVGAYGAITDVNMLTPKGNQMATTTIQPSPVYDTDWHNLLLNWGILLVHATVYLVVTAWLQKRKDLFKG